MELTIGISDQGLLMESSPVGELSGSSKTDFYVYEWYIINTGEIFYIGKGRGNRYKEKHTRAYEAEKVRSLYETGVKFVAENLTEEEAVQIETQEMLRVLNETKDVLTNRITPLFAKRDNGYSKSPSTPEFELEKTPCFFATVIDEHYFGEKPKTFDVVNKECLKKVYFIENKVRFDENEIIYGGNYLRYYDIVCELLKIHGYSVIKTKFAKSVTAWIYIGDDDVFNYKNDQRLAIERLGRNIPTYHLLDVLKFLKDNSE